MGNIGDSLLSMCKYVTPESLAVVGALLAVFVGYKVSAFMVRTTWSAAKQVAGIAPLTAAVMVVSGLGTGSYGLGEVLHRGLNNPSKQSASEVVKKNGIDDDTLIDLAKSGKDEKTIQAILEYAKVRDSSDQIKAQTVANLVAMTDDKNKEAIKDLLKYLQAKEDKAVIAKQNEALTLVSTSLEYEGASVTKEIKDNRIDDKSQISLQAALGAIGFGIAMCWCGIVTFRNRKSFGNAPSESKQSV